MIEAGICLRAVCKTYSNSTAPHAALCDIDLNIPPGQFLGVIGGNGSGKSTLMRLLNGLVLPTSGSVHVDGLDTAKPENLEQVRRNVGIVFQNPDNQLISPLAEEEIAFGLENLGLSVQEIERRIDAALITMGLADLRHHAPHLLSGGQKQRLALASVLAMEPQYLVLDEPTSMLDGVSRRELLQHLQLLQQQGRGIILSSHDPRDVLGAQRIVVLHQGRIAIEGSPREVFAREEELLAMGLEVPALNRLLNRFGEAGICLEGHISDMEELVDRICPS